MIKRVNHFTMILIISLVISGMSHAYDDVITHPAITEKASDTVNSKLDGYLKNSLGINDGLATRFTSKKTNNTVRDWLKKGSTDEDYPNCRASNHFHNPLLPWNSSFMSDDVTPVTSVIRDFCTVTGWPLLLRKSDVTWATGYLSPAPNGPKDPFALTFSFDTPYGWDRARKAYFKALTDTKAEDRGTSFADTFETVGHVLHLLQDMAVPAHTRNDFQSHITIDPVYGRIQPYENYVKIFPSLVQIADPTNNFPSFINPSVTAFWDTDQYNRDLRNPSSATSIGMSEFTNANFLSNKTIFNGLLDDPYHSFPFPSWSDVQEYDEIVDRTKGKVKTYLRKTGNGEIIEHLVAAKWFYKYLPSRIKKSGLQLDDKCHDDYARKLVPRAVGYSAGLLNYFFRGDIRLEYTTSPNPGYVIVNKTDEDMSGLFQILYDNNEDQRVKYMDGNFTVGKQARGDVFDITAPADAKEPGKYILAFKGNMGNEKGAVAGYVPSRLLEITPPDQFIYSMINDIGNDPYFRSIKAKVKNASPSEQMKNGTIQAVAKYKSDTYDAGFMYSMSDPQAIDLSSDAAVEVAFNFDNDPIPVDVTDLYLEVIFKGTIGNEAYATASGVKDIREPTPIDVFNDTDKSCISGSWYSTADAVDLMDTNSPKDHIADTWDVNPHILQDIYVKISSMAKPQKASPSVYNAVVPSLKPGEFQRVMYILTDEYYTYSFYSTWIPSPGNFDRWSHANKEHTFNGTAVKNQTDYSSDPAVCGRDPWCYIYHNPGYYSLRGNDMWWGGGVVYINQPYPADSSCKGY